MPNRYTMQSNTSTFNPLSIEEMSMAGLARGKRDATTVAAIQNINDQYNVFDFDEQKAQDQISPLKNGMEALTNNIVNNSSDNQISELTKLSAMSKSLHSKENSLYKMTAAKNIYETSLAEAKASGATLEVQQRAAADALDKYKQSGDKHEMITMDLARDSKYMDRANQIASKAAQNITFSDKITGFEYVTKTDPNGNEITYEMQGGKVRRTMTKKDAIRTAVKSLLKDSGDIQDEMLQKQALGIYGNMSVEDKVNKIADEMYETYNKDYTERTNAKYNRYVPPVGDGNDYSEEQNLYITPGREDASKEAIDGASDDVEVSDDFTEKIFSENAQAQVQGIVNKVVNNEDVKLTDADESVLKEYGFTKPENVSDADFLTGINSTLKHINTDVSELQQDALDYAKDIVDNDPEFAKKNRIKDSFEEALRTGQENPTFTTMYKNAGYKSVEFIDKNPTYMGGDIVERNLSGTNIANAQGRTDDPNVLYLYRDVDKYTEGSGSEYRLSEKNRGKNFKKIKSFMDEGNKINDETERIANEYLSKNRTTTSSRVNIKSGVDNKTYTERSKALANYGEKMFSKNLATSKALKFTNEGGGAVTNDLYSEDSRFININDDVNFNYKNNTISMSGDIASTRGGKETTTKGVTVKLDLNKATQADATDAIGSLISMLGTATPVELLELHKKYRRKQFGQQQSVVNPIKPTTQAVYSNNGEDEVKYETVGTGTGSDNGSVLSVNLFKEGKSNGDMSGFVSVTSRITNGSNIPTGAIMQDINAALYEGDNTKQAELFNDILIKVQQSANSSGGDAFNSVKYAQSLINAIRLNTSADSDGLISVDYDKVNKSLESLNVPMVSISNRMNASIAGSIDYVNLNLNQ